MSEAILKHCWGKMTAISSSLLFALGSFWDRDKKSYIMLSIDITCSPPPYLLLVFNLKLDFLVIL